MKQLQAINDRVILKVIERSEKTKGGIFIPETVTKNTTYGKVLSVGKEVSEIKVGDTVLFEENGFGMVEDAEGEIVRVGTSNFVVAIVEGDSENVNY